MDKISYLTPNIRLDQRGTDVLFSKLLVALREVKQDKADARQWTGLISGFTQKGIKQAEIDDCGVLDFVSTFRPQEKIGKSMLIGHIATRMPHIKCVDLALKNYAHYKNIRASKYIERLYILSSEGMVADDRIEDLMFRIESLGFDPGPLMQDPGLVDRMESEMKLLKQSRPEMYDFKHHHFSSSVEKHGRNLMAHARISQLGNLFFVEEIQSDWAQRGRANDWKENYPRAPFVTNTEQWSGVVLRDLMHTAAQNKDCERFAWINADMRNGYSNSNSDDLSIFYDTIIKKMAAKAIDKAGGKITYETVDTKNGPRTVQGFKMTDAVRAALMKSQPLYSRETLLPRSMEFDESERSLEKAEVLKDCTAMLGSTHTVRFVARLYDVAHGTEVAGKYIHQGIELSLRAKNLNRTARHEAWHFADENFLLAHEKRQLRLAFSEGSALNEKTRELLHSMHQHNAARQCVDHKECTAHAFALWCEGVMELEPAPAGIFQRILKALERTADWLEEKVFGVKVHQPEDLFRAMREGSLAVRHRNSYQETPKADVQSG